MKLYHFRGLGSIRNDVIFHFRLRKQGSGAWELVSIAEFLRSKLNVNGGRVKKK